MTNRERIVLQVESEVRSRLAEQSAALAVDLASKVVRQEISHDRQSEIVREALGLMGPGSNAN